MGKTTIAVNLADGILRETASKVLCVDADPQAGAFKWFRRRSLASQPYTLVAGAVPDLHRTLPKLLEAGAFGDCLVDCPAGISNITRSALLVADVVIVPVQPSCADFDSSEGMLSLLAEICEARPDVRVLVAINKGKAGSHTYTREARIAAAGFFGKEPSVNVRVLNQMIYDRMDVLRSYAEGKTIFEFAGSGVSAHEFGRLTEEVLTYVQ